MKIRNDFLPLNRPSIGQTEIEQVVACLKSGWITTGPVCREFEEKFSTLTGAPHAISLTSATAGMHLAFTALDLQKGDEVITPSLTFASTVNMISLCGAVPVFADIDYATLTVDPNLLERHITPKTKAIIPVHFAGAPADMEPIIAVCKKHGLFLMEDAAHAIGTYYRGTHAGGFGYPAIFSFHPIKNITTAEGGMVTLYNPDMERQLRLLRFHGIERDAWKRYGKGGNPEYDIMAPGFKYNLTDMQAALGLAQLSRLDEMNARRSRLAGIYLENLREVNGLELPGVPDYPHIHSWHLFVIKMTAMDRADFMKRLSEYNIGYGIHFPACHLLNYVKEKFGQPKIPLPTTEAVAEKIISLPLFPDMKESDVLYICDSIKEILGHASL